MPEASDPQPNPVEPRRGETFEAFWDRLQQRRTTGARARAALIARLSTMTDEELRRVPAAVMGWVGPQGLATLLARSRAQGLRAAGAGMVARKRVEPVSSASAARKPGRSMRDVVAGWWKRQPLPWTALKALLFTLVVASAIVLGAPFAWRVVTDAPPPGSPHLCHQLDRWTGDCRYMVGSRTLTLGRAAALLRMPPEVLLQANAWVPADAPLPRGITLVVPRRSGLNLR